MTSHTHLLGQLFLAQLVQNVELSCEDNVVNETNTGQFHSDDDQSVGNHHGDCSEVDFQVLWKLLSSCVTRVLGTRKFIQFWLVLRRKSSNFD